MRTYSSPTRDADAAATRRRIIDAAELLFVRDGFAATSIRAIAAEAQVSVQSVNLAGPKASLLIAAFELSFAGDEGRHALTSRPALVEIMGNPDTEAALAAYVTFLSEANQRSAPIIRALRAAADADAAARAAYRDLEERRHRDMVNGARWLVSRGLVALTLTAEAADVLGYVTGPETYLAFAEDRGWRPDRYEDWLARALRSLIIDVY